MLHSRLLDGVALRRLLPTSFMTHNFWTIGRDGPIPKEYRHIRPPDDTAHPATLAYEPWPVGNIALREFPESLGGRRKVYRLFQYPVAS